MYIGGVEIHVVPELGWECWRVACDWALPWSTMKPRYQKIFMGPDCWAALLFDMNARPAMVETDPGPLDAKVS